RRPAWVEALAQVPFPEAPEAPPDEWPNRAGQVATVVGEFVHLASSGRRKHSPRDDVVALEVPQPLGEELAADAGQTVEQVREAPRTRHELAHDQQGPAIARYVERPSEGAVLVVSMLRHMVPQLALPMNSLRQPAR